jgi:hypothetical protein
LRNLGTYRFKDTGGSRDTNETDTRTSQTNLKTNPAHRLTRQTTPANPGTHHASPHTTPLTRSSAVVVTVMATAPGRGSSEGASPTASVTALLRVPGGAEISETYRYMYRTS